jgi:hypothetical protein
LAIQVASGAGQQLLALIGDILDIARIESGQLSLAPQRPTCANWWLRCAGYSKAWRGKSACNGTSSWGQATLMC